MTVYKIDFLIPCLSSVNNPGCWEDICKTFPFGLAWLPPGTLSDPLPLPRPLPRPELTPGVAPFLAFIPLPPPPRPPPLPLEGGGIIALSGTPLSNRKSIKLLNLNSILQIPKLGLNALVENVQLPFPRAFIFDDEPVFAIGLPKDVTTSGDVVDPTI